MRHIEFNFVTTSSNLSGKLAKKHWLKLYFTLIIAVCLSCMDYIYKIRRFIDPQIGHYAVINAQCILVDTYSLSNFSEILDLDSVILIWIRICLSWFANSNHIIFVHLLVIPLFKFLDCRKQSKFLKQQWTGRDSRRCKSFAFGLYFDITLQKPIFYYILIA